ncbi:MAG TPA: helix-turn-helix transcriptional regulator [Actinomycetota bacterium]|nr:helix-turn-helix transcriptional regulator [Actinomycetota bacterium]
MFLGPLDRTLRARREQLGLDQAQVAEFVGVSQQTISRWESGAITPPPKRLAKLAVALDIDLDRMLAYAGYLSNGADWPRWQLLNTFSERMTELSDDELAAVIDQAWEELSRRTLQPESH